jgi:hypothetical protein
MIPASILEEICPRLEFPPLRFLPFIPIKQANEVLKGDQSDKGEGSRKGLPAHYSKAFFQEGRFLWEMAFFFFGP